ncbi:hypothetical protein BRY73_24600 [Ochrobactrum sp. P6BS-III]|uniref:hypothetical protein n=1 Tax=unclassified Ochrobactrum TaxID=239106 RepID=UPI0009D1BA4F|nr:hypothetical protein [Ochrobactrum sp. P6BSIII]OOL13609.1 hypothetical protein BRY73_24600 [Ochrobactrum sp. P6BS-III]
MATLNIAGRRVTVDDSFLQMSPQEQQSTVDEIAATLQPAQAPITPEVRQGLDEMSDMTRNPTVRNPDDSARNSMLGKVDTAMRGAADMLSLGFADEIAAGLGTGFGYLGDYDQELARQRGIDQSDNENRFGYRLGGQLAGGIAGGAGLARNGLSVATNAANAGKGLGKVAFGSAIDGALLGLGQGFGSGEGGFDERAKSAVKSGAVGFGLGGATPLAVAGASAVAKPLLAPLTARLNPQKYADQALETALTRSGSSKEKVAQALRNAIADGQDQFTVADALGHSGRRMLSTAVRNPNDARQEVFEQLVKRQSGQGDRLANTLAEGFGATDTAAQRGAFLTEARDTLANQNYRAARQDAGAVDLSPVIQHIDDVIRPGVQKIVSPADEIAGDSIEKALTGYKNRMTDGKSVLSDFTRALNLKTDVSDAVQRAQRAGEGNRARVLGMLNAQLDQALENASPAYRAANDTFKSQSKVIDALETGKNAASSRMRAADNIGTFDAMNTAEQNAFRPGYADPWIARVEAASSAPTTNKARMLITEKTAQEFPAFAVPDRAAQMGRRIAREQKMFETANEAMGGSKTADNLADAAEMAQFDPAVFNSLLRGDWKGAAISTAMRGINESKGLPPSVLGRVGRALTETDPEKAFSILDRAVTKKQISVQQRDMLRSMILGSSSGVQPRILGQERRAPLEITVRPNR